MLPLGLQQTDHNWGKAGSGCAQSWISNGMHGSISFFVRALAAITVHP